MTYELRGEFLEACDCSVGCPCWVDESPHDDECAGIVAWHVERGEIGGVDVSGLTAVSVSHHGGHRQQANARVALFVDERATEDQLTALTDAFTGKLGGPLGELAELTDELTEMERTPITLTSDERGTKITVGRKVEADMQVLVGETDRAATVADSTMAALLGPPEAGKARQFRLALGHDQLDVDVTDSNANRGRFSYHHSG